MKTKIIILFAMSWLCASTAESSTLRVACDDQAIGAEVSINGKYKGECPIDIQVSEGKHLLKAVKKIDGKNTVFEEKIRVGDGVTKRIDVTFGTIGASEAPAIKIDQKAIAQQRYEAEMAEYNQSIQSCLPKHAVELRRLQQAAREGNRRNYLDCRRRFYDQAHDDQDRGVEGYYMMMCGSGRFEDGPVRSDYSPEERELLEFRTHAESWCKKQFTEPKAP